jgi:tetratricopeptide (TPR) repeat protein
LHDYDEAIHLDPTNPINFVRRAFARTKLKDFDEAIQDCTRAVGLDAECDAALKLRGDAHLWQGHPDDAIKDFGESLRCNPKNAATFRARATAWVDKKDYEKALLDLDEAILLQPQNALPFKTRGVCHLAQEKPQQAIADLSEAIQRDPNQATLYDLRAAAYIANGDFSSALQDSEKTVRLDPNDVGGHLHLALLLATCDDAKIRDGKKAINHGVWACGLSEWKYDQAIAVLAAAYAEAGDWENATRFQKTVIEMSKNEQQKLEREKGLFRYEKREPLRVFKGLKPSQFVPTLARP